MAYKNLTVYKANKVIEASYRLTLHELRVLSACIGQINPTKELLVTQEFELSAKDFAVLFAVSDENAYQALIDVTKILFNRYIVIDNPYPDRPEVKRLEMRWISSIKHVPDKGKVLLMFAQDILPYLSLFKGEFTKYKLEHIGKMTCIYAMRLYELLVQWQNTGSREIELDWLKKQFELDASYDRMDNFKARVIDPAVKDINKHSNLQVSWTQRKTGRRVTHLTFTFAEKPPLTPEKNKAAAKPKEKKICGVALSDIEKLAKVGESWEEAATRINIEKQAAQFNRHG
jgi:plasmid replication initiation protein